MGTRYNLGDYIKEPEVFFAKDNVELATILDELTSLRFLKSPVQFFDGSTINVGIFSITTQGFARAQNLMTTNQESKKVFVAMGFKDDLLEVHNKAIKPAYKECGFDAFLVSEKNIMMVLRIVS